MGHSKPAEVQSCFWFSRRRLFLTVKQGMNIYIFEYHIKTARPKTAQKERTFTTGLTRGRATHSVIYRKTWLAQPPKEARRMDTAVLRDQ